MADDRAKRLEVYIKSMEEKLANPTVPKKHENRVETYRSWLKSEVTKSKLRLEELRK
jgi:hypothetical protein